MADLIHRKRVSGSLAQERDFYIIGLSPLWRWGQAHRYSQTMCIVVGSNLSAMM